MNGTTNSDLELLCEALVRDYMKRKGYQDMSCIDIEGFVTEYLGMQIIYESFAEPDPDRIGFLGDGKSRLWIWRDGQKLHVIFPENTIVIEKSLLQPEMSGKKRFTIAHEGAHKIVSEHLPVARQTPFHTDYCSESEHTVDGYRESQNWDEIYANRGAACLLIPAFQMAMFLKKYNRGKPVICYDGYFCAAKEKRLIKRIADAAGVSYGACFIRLKELNLFEFHPIGEYLTQFREEGQNGKL